MSSRELFLVSSILISFGVVLSCLGIQERRDRTQRLVSENQELKNEIDILKSELSNYIEKNKSIQARPYVERTMSVSAYCPCKLCCGKYSDGKTATGTDASTKGVAVDPDMIPYGTMIFIPEYGYTEADDCGSAIKGNKLDVRFPTHQEARNWGVRILKVRIYKKGM